MTEVEAFILIGGNSIRFGSDKALAPFRGQPLLKRTAETIRTALSPKRITLVAASPEQFSMTLDLTEDLPFIFDLYTGRGAWGGLHAALAYAATPWIFVIACDLPLVTSDLLLRLADFISDDHDAVIPIQADGRLQPLCAFYRVKPCLALAEDVLSANRPTPPLQTIAERVNARTVKFDEISDIAGAKDILLNANTVSDIEKACHSADRIKKPEC